MTSTVTRDKNLRLADELIDRGQYVEAKAIYSNLLRENPADPHLLALRGYASHRIGDPAAALEDFNDALALKHDAPNTLFLRAKCKERLGELDAAIEDYRAVLALAPNTADAYSGIAMIREYRGDIQGARREHHKALQIDPELKSAQRFFQKYGR
jgi:tetratricopeptide (TPR) repeat protein